MAAQNEGRLVLVVGPSGAGKDTLIDAFRKTAGAAPFAFPDREITRGAGAPGETHIAVDEEEYARRTEDGSYVLHWRAHGLGYGIPVSIERDIARGKNVMVNVSRAAVEDARKRFPGLLIVNVTAPDAVLRTRLKRRGRETLADIEERIETAHRNEPTGEDVVTIVNDGTVDEAVGQLVSFLERV